MKKRHCFKSQFAKVDSQSIWITFDKLAGKNINQCNEITCLKSNGTLITEKEKIASLLCDSFILNDESTPVEKNEFLSNLESQSETESGSIILTPRDIGKVISKLKLKHSNQDKIPIKMLTPLLPLPTLIPMS